MLYWSFLFPFSLPLWDLLGKLANDVDDWSNLPLFKMMTQLRWHFAVLKVRIEQFYDQFNKQISKIREH